MSTGKAMPLGATVHEDGVNFAIFSRHATAVTLILFESAADNSPCQEIPIHNKTGDIWHCFIKGLKAGACYQYRVDGPNQSERGLRFNPKNTLIDPYAKALTKLDKWDIKNGTNIPRCIVIDDNDFDWQGDTPLNYPLRFSVLYETHIKRCAPLC